MREVHVRPPVEVKNDKVWRLKKTVYGLNNAAKHWYESLMKVLEETGREKSVVDGTIVM